MMSNDKNKQNEAEEVLDAEDSEVEKIEAESVDSVDENVETDEQSLEAQLEAAQLEVVKMKDAYLRAKAEEDNVRRRSEKEVANSRKFAVEGFAKEMMTVRDSLKLACDIDLPAEADESMKNIHEGVEVTLKQLDAAFSRFSLAEISPEVGSKLDPNLHQAMSIVESEDVQSGCIVNVIQAGFQLQERLLRPAMVVVAK